MWGNVQGWVLSVILTGALIFGMHTLNKLGEISAPSSFGIEEANLGAVELPTPPSQLVARSEASDANALYRAAIVDYTANQPDYERFGSSKDGDDANRLAGLKSLLDAAHARTATIFADDPGQIVTYGDKPELDALSTLGHLAARAALLKKADYPHDAQKYFEAEFSLGAHLYDERITVEEFTRGLELMSEASGGMTRLLQKMDQSDRAMEFHRFDEARKQYYNDRILPLLKVLQSIDSNVVGDHAGDIIYLARHAPERMFRVEAIFAMGRMKYFAGENGRIGNQRGAIQELKRLSQDSDAVIRRAASEARDLTMQKYQRLR